MINVDKRVPLDAALKMVLEDNRLTIEESRVSLLVQVMTAYGYDVEKYAAIARHNMKLEQDLL